MEFWANPGIQDPSPEFGKLSPEFGILSPEFCNVQFRTPVRSTELEYGVRYVGRFPESSTEFIPDSDSVLQYGVRSLSTEPGTEPDFQNPVRNLFRTQTPYSSPESVRSGLQSGILNPAEFRTGPEYKIPLETNASPEFGVLNFLTARASP